MHNLVPILPGAFPSFLSMAVSPIFLVTFLNFITREVLYSALPWSFMSYRDFCFCIHHFFSAFVSVITMFSALIVCIFRVLHKLMEA